MHHCAGHDRASFADLCAHYNTMPNAVRVRRPTDKDAVESLVSTLKEALRGCAFEALDELRATVAAVMRARNERPNSRTGKRPDDLIALERHAPLPERYPLAFWSKHRVRSDCHCAGELELLLCAVHARRQRGRRPCRRDVADCV